jgi:NADH-quinone oxidoreductase subunit A
MGSTTLWPLVLYFVLVVLLAAGMLGLSYVLGPRHHSIGTREPYEGGIVSTGTARIRLDVKFYLVAMFFVVFDLESVFIFAWAVALRASGWAGYVEMLTFVGILLAALVYVWRLGGLEWRPRVIVERTVSRFV